MTSVQDKKVTLLVQNLRGLVSTAQTPERFPALETLLSRGHHFRAEAESPDHFRFRLFGIEPDGDLPVAALTRAGDGGQKPDRGEFWLRTDPVTLWADMARVVITSHGMADLDEFERDEIENTVRSVLKEEGIQLHADHPERWCIALKEPTQQRFMPLQEALGMDLAEAMQENPESLHWRRVMNEIQIALHSCPVNVRRRNRGQQEINSVWFWGGGFIPDASRHDLFDTVYSDNPVSRGLATVNDCRLRPQCDVRPDEFYKDDQSILVDWTAGLHDPEFELSQVESLAEELLDRLQNTTDEIVLFCGRNNGWRYDAGCSKKFWRRRRSLGDICLKLFPA